MARRKKETPLETYARLRVGDLTVTERSDGLKMCGCPYHQLREMVRLLLAAGHRVVVFDVDE